MSVAPLLLRPPSHLVFPSPSQESAYKQTEKGGLVILSPPQVRWNCACDLLALRTQATTLVFVKQVPYTLEITTVIQPQKNTSLEGEDPARAR